MTVHVEYNRESDTAYIRFGNGAPSEPRRVSLDPWLVEGDVCLDFDEAGRIVGLVVCEASTLLPPDALPEAPSGHGPA